MRKNSKNSKKTNQYIEKVKSLVQSLLNTKFFFPLFLFTLIVLCYGVLIPVMGFSGDDWALIWDSYRINNFNFIAFRPIAILLYKILAQFLSPIPYQWFLIAIIFRWLGALAIFLFLRELFPDGQKWAGLFAILYAFYPGFIVGYMTLQVIAPLLQPFFLFLSFYLMVIWIKQKKHHWLILFLSLLSATINLTITEYYFFLELLRPIIIWLVLMNQEEPKSKILRIWFPYLIIFISGLLWRISLVGISNPYNTSLVNNFISSPLPTLAHFINTVIRDFQTTILQPMLSAFQIPSNLGPLTLILYLALVLFIGFSVFIYLSFSSNQRGINLKNKPSALFLLLFGITTFLLAGVSFWIAGLHIIYGFDVRNRFAMTQALSATIFAFIPIILIKKHYEILSILIACVLAGLFCGVQVIGANNFRNEWTHQEEFFWNFAWRVPNLKPGSVIIMNEPDFNTIGDNALSAAINWNYVKQTHPAKLDYYVYYDEFHLKLFIPDYENIKVFSSNHIIGDFTGNTDQTIVMHFDASSCLRILDPEIEKFNPDITDFTQKYMQYTNLNIIQADHYSETGSIDSLIFRNELIHGWCYFFEKADLARQLKDWEGIESLGKIAFSLNEHPNNAAEYLPFIEGYAHLENWDKAIELTRNMLQISSAYKNMACALWNRISDSTNNSPNKQAAVTSIINAYQCKFNN